MRIYRVAQKWGSMLCILHATCVEWSGRLTDGRILIVVKDSRPEQLWIFSFYHGAMLSHEGEVQEGTWQQIKDPVILYQPVGY
jgi:hypothetical protein